eukprot:CAMPEP_0206444486 /NCGR_PEP_ID=MMETSP0324_2-20121206/14938_1 /ASSEMBLY_ACC=CAM_ASM_000836 /TAXON_ID=2866 /ORGANISM="Crypthecodinium cohnii, Strain Seligo" /LENGTH=119 /DNA_ID=CAMNT_0053912513 /DNA_START=82 /DNA_END=441 /DNA_ORIENTATION=-
MAPPTTNSAAMQSPMHHPGWNSTKTRNAAWTLGPRVKDSNGLASPGPGAYEPKHAKTQWTSPNYRFGAKPGGSRNEGPPGPGAYTGKKEHFSKPPSFGFGPPPRTKRYQETTPGPGAYH